MAVTRWQRAGAWLVAAIALWYCWGRGGPLTGNGRPERRQATAYV
ncbi:hypothetical protein [Thermoleptolyngbya sp.]